MGPNTRQRNGRPTRIEKARITREALFKAAAQVVGKVGYVDASIADITRLAGVAQGTIYSYFASRQDLFDQLLPKIGEEMEEYVRARVHGSRTGLEVEERGFRAFMDFIVENPGFLRILNEAETLAPKAFHQHFKNVAKRYVSSLSRSRDNGELGAYKDRDLEVIAYILMAARSYLAMRFARRKNTVRSLPESVIKAYLRFVSGGLNPAALTSKAVR